MPNCNKKGVILFIVIGVIMVVAMLSIVILRIISNQSRLTHHQLSRIQAQYAAKAGVLYALDKLRRNDDPSWTNIIPPAISVVKRMCRQSTCPDGNSADIIESGPNGLPSSIQQVDITVYDLGTGVSDTRKVSAKATYTYTP